MIVAGLMSGTSMDGIDVATADLTLDGDVLVLRPLGHATVPYSPGLRAALAAALPPAPTTLEAVCRLDTAVGQEFAAAASAAAAPETELLVSHGQTVFHGVDGPLPDGARTVFGTLQIGQPAWIAERTGLPVVSDLRAADVAAGGQGAPLVSLFDVLLLGDTGRPQAALNLGGIANLTAVGPGRAPVAFDAGPANALLDAAVARVSGGREHFDAGGAAAARGTVDPDLLDVLAGDPYYRLAPPKTTGKEHFHAGYLDSALARTGHAIAAGDLLATLTEHTAAVVGAACLALGVERVVASGGGTANPTMMAALARRLAPAVLTTVEHAGIPSAAKEAYAFAVLGFLTAHGLPGTVPSCTGARHPAVLGRITPGPLRPFPLRPEPPVAPRLLVVEGQ